MKIKLSFLLPFVFSVASLRSQRIPEQEFLRQCKKSLGSGIRKKFIPDPGSRGKKASDPGFQIWIRNLESHGMHG
jgi:hypothetical protein